ncbi:MAG: hypothetical protein HY879_25960 [Deltaproteobacteria bacterium]|nr:hypothetical protein [Deltaproteobacteria bacterium]
MVMIGVKPVRRGGFDGKPHIMDSELRTPNSELKASSLWLSPLPFFPLLFFLFLLSVSGCAHLSPDLQPENVSPFFHIQTDREKQGRRLDGAGPFYSQAESPEEKEWTFRPFFSYRENLKEQTEELEYLYPLGRYRKTPEGTLKRFIPLYSSFTPAQENEEKDKNNVDFFPVFWGKDKEGKSYGGVFPFGGEFRGRFARDEIQFVLWPLYTRVREGETQTYNVLWPIFSYTEGGERSGFRIWPLYGQEKQEGMGAYQKTFFLWPIGQYQQRYLDTDHPKTYFYLFPLYLSEQSPNEHKTIILWPFFNFYSEDHFNYHQVDFPWPIIQFARGENTEAFKFWPLLTYRKVEQRQKMSLFWPIFIQEKEEDEERDEVLNRFIYISKFHQVYFKKENRWERLTKFWPFFHYAEDGRGMEHFYFPDLMPADWEGLERNYGMLFRVYEYYQDGKGKEISKFLWGLYYHQKQKDLNRIEVSLLFTYVREKETLYVSFLKGLLGYYRDGPKKQLKIFYLPISWEEAPVTGKPPESPSGG